MSFRSRPRSRRSCRTRSPKGVIHRSCAAAAAKPDIECTRTAVVWRGFFEADHEGPQVGASQPMRHHPAQDTPLLEQRSAGAARSHASRPTPPLPVITRTMPWLRACARRRNPIRAKWASSCRIPCRSMVPSTARVRRRRAWSVLRSRQTRGGPRAGRRDGAAAATRRAGWRQVPGVMAWGRRLGRGGLEVDGLEAAICGPRAPRTTARRGMRPRRLVPGGVRVALALHRLDVTGHVSPEALLLAAQGTAALRHGMGFHRRPPARGIRARQPL